MFNFKKSKKEVIGINPKTNVSEDYWNEFYGRTFFFGDILKLKESILNLPIKTYSQYFPINTYNNVINSRNKDRIIKLDRIVFTLNNINETDLTLDQVKDLFNQAHNLIYNK